VIAVAHRLRKLIFQVLSTGPPYAERGLAALDEHQKYRIIRHPVRRLGKLGIAIYSTRPAATGGIGRCMKAVVLDPGPATAS
jgi:hypothetical protein